MSAYLLFPGCPPAEANAEGKIPKKIADEYGFKAISKEIKKATTQLSKLATGVKPKNYSELWQIRVSANELWTNGKELLLLMLVSL